METLANEKKEGLTRADKTLAINYSIAGVEITGEVVEHKEVQEERTRIRKQMFLEYFRLTAGVITASCQKVGVSRQTFYDWKKNDPEFLKAIEGVNAEKLNIAEDVLWHAITIDRDSSCARYYLDRRHPLYKPKSTSEVVPGERTLEDLFDEAERKENDTLVVEVEAGEVEKIKQKTNVNFGEPIAYRKIAQASE